MLKSSVSVFLSGIILSFHSLAGAPKKVSFATFPIPLMVESANKGLFVDLTREIARRCELEVNISVAPVSRTLVDFSNNKVDGFFPGLDVYMSNAYTRTESFYTKVDYAFYRKGEELYRIKDLEGKKVGLTFRYPYPKELTSNKKIRFEYAEDDVSNMRKLASKSIDAFIVEERSGLQALRQSQALDIEYKKENPIGRQDVFYAFQNNDQGRALAERFTEVIKKMKKDGSFDRILSRSQGTSE